MFRKTDSFKILVLLAGWLLVQSAALHHELSSEHLISNHLCLAQVAHLDDACKGNDGLFVVSIASIQFVINERLVSVTSAYSIKTPPSRAPPHNRHI